MMSVLRGLLLDNIGVKLVALLLAVVLYLHVYTERPATMQVSFPVQIADLADSLSLTGAAPEPVRAELRGTGKQLIRLRLTEPRLKVSLAGVSAGRYQRTLTADDLPILPDDRLEVQQLISPRVLSLEIDRKISRRVPVAARVNGTPRGGFTQSGIAAVDPATVLVVGPRREIAHVDSVRLRPIRIEGKADTVSVVTGSDSLPPFCSIDPPTVRVTVALVRGGP